MNNQKRLTRSIEDRMFAGVCGGIADYLEIDPTLVRLFFAALTLLASGSGIVLYIILMLIVPEQPRHKPKVRHELIHDEPMEEAPISSSTQLEQDTPREPATEADNSSAKPNN